MNAAALKASNLSVKMTAIPAIKKSLANERVLGAFEKKIS
jgi:hypothetical protein